MSPQIPASPPSRPLRSKRESSTITRAMSKALADVMNKDNALCGSGNPAESDVASITSPVPRRAITREGQRGSRPSLDLPRGNNASDKPSTKPVKRPASSFSRPTAEANNSSPIPDDSPLKQTEKVFRSRTSMTLRGLSSALQPKSSHPPSALPKYKSKVTPDTKAAIPRIGGTKKRLSDWDGGKDERSKEATKGSGGEDADDDDDFVTVERPISPLPRRAARQSALPIPLSLTPSTPSKKNNILHKPSSSMSSTPPRPSKVPKATSTSITPISRLQKTQVSTSRPSSSASVHSRHETPLNSPTRKPTSVSKAKTVSSIRSVRRRPTLPDSMPNSGKLDASPATPFQLPETSGNSLLSPPLSPFLEGVSIDSIDAGDVSAFLSSVISPTKPSSTVQRSNDLPSQTCSHEQHLFPKDPTSPPPQTPTLRSSLRAPSILTTDPRQSILSLRKYLENSGDPEHLLAQPLPSILTSEARERLLSFGFSPDFAPPPFPSGARRPEPQTPSPVPEGQSFMSISQVLFPQMDGAPPKTSRSGQEPTLVDLLKMQLASAEAQRADRDVRIERLEAQLLRSREAREQEAAELSTQVSDLEEQLRVLLVDRERERDFDRGAQMLEAQLRDKDAEWERQVAASVAQAQEQSLADQAHLRDIQRRKWCVRSATEAWEAVRTTALSELELVRSNRIFVEVTLAGLDVSMQQLRQSLVR